MSQRSDQCPQNSPTIMQQAIEKASKLITLLQRQNQQLRNNYEALQEKLAEVEQQNRESLEISMEMQATLNAFQKQYKELESQKEQVEHQLEQVSSTLALKIKSSKQLHEKLSVNSAKCKQQTSRIKQLSIKYKTLQNQNQFLLQKFERYDQKQNCSINKLQKQIQSRQNQVDQEKSIKEAFSRRCQEMKNQIIVLRQTIADMETQIVQKELCYRESAQQRVLLDKKGAIVSEVQKTVDRMIRKYLSAKPIGSLRQQLDQISNYLNYRISHIETLMRQIINKIPTTKQTRDLHQPVKNMDDLGKSAQRLTDYLTGLTQR